MRILNRFLFALGLLIPWVTEAAPLCATPPPSSEMDPVFYQSLADQIKNQKIRIAVFPFQDGSQLQPDPILEKGFSVALIDLLKRSPKIGVYSPLLIMGTVVAQRLTSIDLFSADKIAAAGVSLGATHAVMGMFQRQGSTLRFFVKILDLKKNGVIGKILEYRSEESERFFSVNADMGKNVLEAIGGGKFDSANLGQYLRQSPSFEAFRYYIKGIEKSLSYQEVDLDIAKVWFEKATALSYDFAKAYEEKARALFMMALIRKQMGQDSTLLLQEAEGGLRSAHFTIGIPAKKKQGESSIRASTLRWWQENFVFAHGLALLSSQKNTEAAVAFREAADLVPEDGLAHFYLAQSGGNSSEARLAKKLNPCVP